MIAHAVRALLELPREHQVQAARELIASLPPADPEAWNSTFGPGSLFEAWTATSVATHTHSGLVRALQPFLTPGFVIVDVGGGDGSVWRRAFTAESSGTLVVVDPVAEAIERVRSAVPAGVEVVGIVGFVQDVQLPTCDAIVCSMTLHHLAGADAAERAAHGLAGVGKVEVLQSFGAALRPGGRAFLVEADVDCDLDLPAGSAQLADNIFDSYVRRCGRSVLVDLEQGPAHLHARWEHLLRHWFLEQIAVADLPIERRDVYELTVPRWKALIARSGLKLVEHQALDRCDLFQLYVLEP